MHSASIQSSFASASSTRVASATSKKTLPDHRLRIQKQYDSGRATRFCRQHGIDQTLFFPLHLLCHSGLLLVPMRESGLWLPGIVFPSASHRPNIRALTGPLLTTDRAQECSDRVGFAHRTEFRIQIRGSLTRVEMDQSR